MDATAAANEQKIAAFLAGEGLTPPQIAGVLGNIQQESGFKPLAPAWDVNGLSGGIVQWHTGRLTSMENYVSAHGGTGVGTVDQELGYLGTELAPGGPYSGALAAVKKATTPAAAAQAWNRTYEGGTDPNGVRESNAEKIYATGAAGAGTVTDASFVGNLGSGLGHLLNHPLADIPLVGSAADTLLPNASLTNAAGDVAGSVWKSAAPDVYRLALGFLAGGLVLGGLYLAAKPAVHSVAGKVSDAAGNVGKLAALA